MLSKFKILKLLEMAEGLSGMPRCKKRTVGAVLIPESADYSLNMVCDEDMKNYENKWFCRARNIPFDINNNCKDCGKPDNPCPALHAEIACLERAKIKHILEENPYLDAKGGTMLVSYSPCYNCCSAMIFAGIQNVIVKEPRLSTKDIPSYCKNADEYAERYLTRHKVNYIRLWEVEE